MGEIFKNHITEIWIEIAEKSIDLWRTDWKIHFAEKLKSAVKMKKLVFIFRDSFRIFLL